MTRLPVVSGDAVVKALVRAGWSIARRHGSHVMLTRVDREEVLAVPLHAELKRGTLRGILRAARIAPRELVDLL